MTKAADGNKVKVHYSGKLETGEIFDSSRERGPLEFTIGQSQMIPGFEKGVTGMEIGEKKTITLSPEEGYGPYDEKLCLPYKRSELPEDLNPVVGMTLQFQSNDGQLVNVNVKEVKDDEIVIDANHFLAGQTLIFDLELVEIN